MSEATNNSKRPTHAIWQIVGEKENKKGYWNRVGSAWMNKDLRGMRLVFDSFPMSGKIVVREIAEQDATATTEGGAQ